MNKLSVVIITYNEEKNIARCLKSVINIADEIVVVDSNSTDKTLQICSSYDVKIINNDFEDFVKQHNFADEQAKYDLIFSIDADEAVGKELERSIIKAKNNLYYDGYFINRLTNYCGKWINHCGWYPDSKLRLYNKKKGKWNGVKIHEKFKLYDITKTSKLNGDLFHYSYYTIEQHINQINKFSSISAEAYITRENNASFYKLLLNPFVKFVKMYFIKKGFLDGYYGFIICYLSAMSTFIKYIKLREIIKNLKLDNK